MCVCSISFLKCGEPSIHTTHAPKVSAQVDPELGGCWQCPGARVRALRCGQVGRGCVEGWWCRTWPAQCRAVSQLKYLLGWSTFSFTAKLFWITSLKSNSQYISCFQILKWWLNGCTNMLTPSHRIAALMNPTHPGFVRRWIAKSKRRRRRASSTLNVA